MPFWVSFFEATIDALVALIGGQIAMHSCMAGVRMAAPLAVLREGHAAWAVGMLLGWCATSLLSSHFKTFSEGHLLALVLGAMLARPLGHLDGSESPARPT